MFRSRLNFSKELVPVQTTSLHREECLPFSTASCTLQSLLISYVTSDRHTASLSEVLQRVTLFVSEPYFCLLSSLWHLKTEKKSKSWLDFFFYVFSECLEQNVLCKVSSMLLLIVRCTFAKTYAVSVVLS